MMRVLLFLILLFLCSGRAHAEWRRAESDNFIIYAELAEAELRETALRLERFDRVLRLRAGVVGPPGPVKFRIHYVARPGDVRDLMEDAPRGAAGFYEPALRGPVAVVPRRTPGARGYGLGAEEILFHEYAHHFMLQYFPATYPAWYVEGFAEFFQTAEFAEDGSILVGGVSPNRALGLVWEQWVPYRQLLANERDHGFNAYTQGWLLTHYAVFNESAGATLRAYLAAIHAGQSGAEAYAATFGRADTPLDRTLQEYMRQRRLPGMRITLRDFTPGPVTVTRLSEAEGETAVLSAGDPGARARRAARNAERYPDHPQAHVELAFSALASEDFTAAETAADRALALDANHVEANLVKGLALIGAAGASDDADDARWARGRGHLVRANNADHDNAAPLFGYFMSFPERRDSPDNALAALERAFDLVPQNPEVRLTLAGEYLRDGRFREASILVMPLVQSVHESEGRAAAQRMLTEAQQGLAGSATAAGEE
ncbi:MAG: tetratricopeptide repeat protein [Sphingomonadaceae bacterium]|nr:tetratricopeptide repeat protein [Sphingomonadaceae bacterium]